MFDFELLMIVVDLSVLVSNYVFVFDVHLHAKHSKCDGGVLCQNLPPRVIFDRL